MIGVRGDAAIQRDIRSTSERQSAAGFRIEREDAMFAGRTNAGDSSGPELDLESTWIIG